MERIVIVTDGSENDHSMIELLKAMFPECDIQIVSRKKDGYVDCPKGSLGDRDHDTS
jgi:hypothetical protein